MITIVQPYIQTILSVFNILALLYAFKKFMGKPHDDLRQIVAEQGLEIKEIKQSLLQGNDRFRSQSSVLEVIVRAVIALIEFEVHYCESEHKPLSKNLEKAKDELNECLSRNLNG